MKINRNKINEMCKHISSREILAVHRLLEKVKNN